MIYFDNAATGGFKPSCVIEKATNVIKYLNANPGRSGHKLSLTGAEFIYKTRKKVSDFFNNGSVDRVIFTKNCSEALNCAIYGMVKKGQHVITTVFEHNSTLRPLFNLQNKGIIDLTIVQPENNEYITKNDILKNLRQNTELVVVNHASNVNGAVNEINEIGELCTEKNITFLVDGAQSGGHLKIDMIKQNIDVLALAGHKGLYAIAGSGILIFQKHVKISPTFQGGTGTETFNPNQPEYYPENLEYGTLNLPAICSLYEGVKYIENNLDFISITLLNLTEYLITKLQNFPKIRVFSKKNPVGIVAFNVLDFSSNDLSQILSTNYDVAVRGGFHCAPLMHKFLNTQEEGLIRVSLSPHNTKKEINVLIDAVKELTSS